LEAQDPHLDAGLAKMQLLPELVVSVLEFCDDMDPLLALLIMTRTGALHYRNACAHILYRLLSMAGGYWHGMRFPCLLSDAWICAPDPESEMCVPRRRMIVEAVIRSGITVPGRSCALWCYKEIQDQKGLSREEEALLFRCWSSQTVPRWGLDNFEWALVPYRPSYAASGRVLLKTKTRDTRADFVLYVHERDRGVGNLEDWVHTPGVGASLWQKAAVYAGPAWLQPDVDIPFRIRPGQITRRPHPAALDELVTAGFTAPKHYITWSPQIAPDLWEILYPIFAMFPEAYIGGSYPLFLMLGGPPDLSGPCSMGWTAGGIDLYAVGPKRPGFPVRWGVSVEIGGREAFRPSFLRGAVLYVSYPDTPLYSELDFEVCDIALILVEGVVTLGCSERSILSLLTGVIRGWADVAICSERAEKYASRGYEMRLGAGGSAGTRHLRFPAYFRGYNLRI
jgi:hypothetical protein